jgi:methionine synthase I (cobalamin-dependent)
VGDVADAVWEVAGAMTPVPGGVGALTTTILLESTAQAAEAAGDEPPLDAAALRRVLGPEAAGLDGRTAARVARLIGLHLATRGGAAASALERRLAAGTVVFDGAMGTELMARGVAAARTAEANRDHSDIVLAVHRAYREAGAQVAIANTFSANRWRCGGREPAIALAAAGVRLARQAAEGRQLVLGSIGPSGRVVGAEITSAEAEDAAAEVALAMADAGADGLIIETMPTTTEAIAALAGCRRATRLPVIVSRTIDRDDPAEIAEFAAACEQGGASAIGVNCAAGPKALAPVVARLAAATRLPVVARPNAGFPERDAAGGWRYRMQGAWLVAQARAYVAAGAAAVGGCCGVTPDHIRALVEARLDRPARPASTATAANPAGGTTSAPERGAHARLFSGAGPLSVIAAVPARLPPGEAADALARLAATGADAVALTTLWPGSPTGGRLSARLRHVADRAGRPGVLELTAGCTGLREAQDALIAAGLLGTDLVLIDDGVFAGTPGGGATALDLVALVDRLRRGRDLGGTRLDAPVPFSIAIRTHHEAIERLGALATAGADAVVLPPTYEPARFRAMMTAVMGSGLPVLAEVLLLPDAATADELDNEVPSLSVPQRLKERLATDPDADADGAVRFLAHWRSRLSGVWLSLADARTRPAERVLAAIAADRGR